MKAEIESLSSRMAQGGNWRAFREEIAALHGKATTEEEYVALLGAHSLLVEVGKHCFDEETYAKLLPVTQAEYRMFLIKEATEDGNVNPVLMERITRREVAAGRMAPNDSQRTLAVSAASVLGDSAKLTTHACRHGNSFCAGVIVATVLSIALQRYDVSPLWLIVAGFAVGWYMNERERKRIEASITARRAQGR